MVAMMANAATIPVAIESQVDMGRIYNTMLQ
jgi:hypothetical protein